MVNFLEGQIPPKIPPNWRDNAQKSRPNLQAADYF
jgi:hypothetical protein